jgi:hypothetical protein
VTFPAVRAKLEGDALTLFIPHDKVGKVAALLDKSEYLQADVRKPGRPRTTGELSQNHAINGAVATIARETGCDFDDVKIAMKHKAVSRGYPFTTVLGQIIPKSEADLTTVEAGYLIDTIEQFCAEYGIALPFGSPYE